jgi:hypothetical protein
MDLDETHSRLFFDGPRLDEKRTLFKHLRGKRGPTYWAKSGPRVYRTNMRGVNYLRLRVVRAPRSCPHRGLALCPRRVCTLRASVMCLRLSPRACAARSRRALAPRACVTHAGGSPMRRAARRVGAVEGSGGRAGGRSQKAGVVDNFATRTAGLLLTAEEEALTAFFFSAAAELALDNLLTGSALPWSASALDLALAL